jgi:hypothetical protein
VSLCLHRANDHTSDFCHDLVAVAKRHVISCSLNELVEARSESSYVVGEAKVASGLETRTELVQKVVFP